MLKTNHFLEMLKERNIKEKWVDIALANPDKIEERGDGTKHFLSQIKEKDNRWLRVVMNTNTNKAVTVFFDRRLRRTYESQS